MLSLFNPYVLLGIFSTIFLTFLGGYYKGTEVEKERQQIEIARLNAEAREKEQALVQAVNTTATNLVKANQDAKVQIQKRDAAIAAGNLKLRIPVKTPVCPVPTASDPAPAPGNSVQAGAEPEPAFVRSLIAITDQGDANTRQLNACIDAYQAIYQTLKGTK